MGCWCGYLSGARCRLAYGPADAAATHCLFTSVKFRLVLPFWYRLTWVVPGKGSLNECVCVFVRNSEVRSLNAPVSHRITRGRNAIFGHVARLPVITLAHQAKSSYRSVDPQTLPGNVHQVDHVPNGPTNSAAITTMFPLRLCGGKLLVVVTRERRYGPSRLRVNDDDDDHDA